MSTPTGRTRQKSALSVEWEFGPKEIESDAASTLDYSHPEPPTVVSPSRSARRLLLLLLAVGFAILAVVAFRLVQNYRLLSQVEREVEAVYRLELAAIEAKDADLLQELQAPAWRGEAQIAAVAGPPRPLPSIELSDDNDVVAIVPVYRGDPGGKRTLDLVEITIRHTAIGDGEFLERRRYVRSAIGEWKHDQIPAPTRDDLKSVEGLRWIDATASIDDLEVITPALRYADSLLDRLCTGDDKPCLELVPLRFSGNRPGRLADVPITNLNGSLIAVPSPSLTFRPLDAAGELRYAQEIAKIVLLSAASQEVSLEQEYQQFLSGETGRAPFLRAELHQAFLADFGLGPERTGSAAAPATEFGSVWDLWWSNYEFTGMRKPSDDALASAARHLVEDLLNVRGADAGQLLIALSRSQAPEHWFDAGGLTPDDALDVVQSWPEPPPVFPGTESLTLSCRWDQRSAWRVRPGGVPIDLGPMCDQGFSASQAAWSPDARRLAVVCSSGPDGWADARIQIADVHSLEVLASLPFEDQTILDLEWAENGRLMWNSWGPSGESALWTLPEEGPGSNVVSSLTPDSAAAQRDADFTFGVAGRFLLEVDRLAQSQSVRMFDLDAPERPLWSRDDFSAAWDGRSERLATLSVEQSDSASRSTASQLSPLRNPESELSVVVTIRDVESGREIARHSIDTHGLASNSRPPALAPLWSASSLIGIEDYHDLVAINVPFASTSQEGLAGRENRPGAIVIWTIGSDVAPIVLDYTKPVRAEWIASDHPDAPTEGSGAALYVSTRASGGLPIVLNSLPSENFETVRISGERRELDRPIDELDPSGMWRVRSKIGRVELRHAEDEALAWWFNAPQCSRFRWAALVD